MSEAQRHSLLGGLRELARSARLLVGRSTSGAAEAGRAAARRLTPLPEAGGPLVAQFGALSERLGHLEAVMDGHPGELHDRVQACGRLVAEAVALVHGVDCGVGERPTPADPRHPATAAVRRAILALERAGGPSHEARRALAALTHARLEIRLLGLEHLGDPPDPAVLAVLEVVSRSAAVAERRAILAAVRDMGEAALGSPLVEAALVDEDAVVRLQGVRVAAQGAGAAAPVQLEALALADPSPAVRRSSVRALLAGGTPRPGARLEQALRDPDPAVRLEAVHATRAHPDGAAVLPLLRALMDPEPALRAAAAETLGELGLAVGGFDPAAPAAARREEASRLRREWAGARFGAVAASDAPRAGPRGESDLDDPLGAEFLVPGAAPQSPGEDDGHGG